MTGGDVAKREPATVAAPPKMPLREWARNSGLGEIAVRAMEIQYKPSERKTADGWEAAWYRLRKAEV